MDYELSLMNKKSNNTKIVHHSPPIIVQRYILILFSRINIEN